MPPVTQKEREAERLKKVREAAKKAADADMSGLREFRALKKVPPPKNPFGKAR